MKKIIGGKKKTETKVTETKKMKKTEPKKVEVKKTTTKVTGKDKKVESKRGRKAGFKKEVKNSYSEKIQKLYEGCVEALESVSEPLESFLEKGNQRAAKESRAILADIKKNIIELWREIQNAKKDMKEVKAA